MRDAFRLYAITGDAAQPARRIALDSEPDSAHALYAQLPAGVYTAMRSYDRERFLALDPHFERTERSMELSGWENWRVHFRRDDIRRAIQATIADYPTEAFVRLDVFPPDKPLRATALDGTPLVVHCVLSLSPWTAPPEAFVREGVRVEFVESLHRQTPLIKSADFALARHPYPLNTQDAYEHLMLGDGGKILEGTSSNFFAFFGEELRTTTEGVLAGITQRLVCELAVGLGFRVRDEAIGRDEIERADEAFLTSSTRGVLPVVAVGGARIGTGVPGERTLALREALMRAVVARAQRAWPVAAEAGLGTSH